MCAKNTQNVYLLYVRVLLQSDNYIVGNLFGTRNGYIAQKVLVKHCF